MKRLLTLGLAALVSGALVSQSLAQTPNDVLNPSTDDDIPARISDLVLPQVQFIFDSVLDPDRVSRVQAVMEGDVNNPRLTEAARSIIQNHIIAQQQVELAIRFLQANREDILGGNNLQFNTVFGNIGQDRDVAVVDPDFLANGRVALGTGMQMVGQQGLFSQFTGIPVTITIQAAAGGGGGGGGNNANNAIATGVAASRLKAGDFVYVGDALAPTPDPDAFVVQIVDIQLPATGGQGGGAGGGGGGQGMPMILGQIIGALPATLGNTTAPLFKVVRFDRKPDTARYDRVLQTFQAIRDALSGFDPDLPTFTQFASPITYQRGFAPMGPVRDSSLAPIWAPGVASFTALDATVDRALSRTGIATLRGADRLVRQAGFSNSDSHYHLDRLTDQGNAQAVDYQNRPTTPLLWTDDNEAPLLAFSNLQVPGSTDEDRAFFRDRMTIFGAPDDPFSQYIGRAFLEESINHAGDFFEDSIAVEPGTLLGGIQSARRPQRGPLFDLSGGGVAGVNDDEVIALPETGVPLTELTAQRWQMIIESFAEHSTDLDQFNVAAFGIDKMFGDFIPDDIRAQAGANYGRFADLIGGAGGANVPSVDPRRVEPFGKRGQGGFFPIVPRN